MQLSTARVDITPTGYTWMAGYGTVASPREATGTHSPLSARAVCLWDGDTPHVVVSADLIGIPASVNTAVRAQLSLPAADLLLVATHTHNGPVLPEVTDPWCAYAITDTGPVDTYAAQLVTMLVALVGDVLTAPQSTVSLDYSYGNQTWSYNRAGLSYKETAVPTLVARGVDGQPRAVLYSYGCHAVTAGGQTRWDGDYPAACSAAVEAVIPGCMALFLPGPAGDQDPTGSRGWGLRDKLGGSLAAAVLGQAATVGRTLTGFASTTYSSVSLPFDITLTVPGLTAVRNQFATRSADTAATAWKRRHADLMTAAIDTWLANGTPLETVMPTPIQTWKLAGSPTLKLCFSGHELVSGYGNWARVNYGGSNGVLLGGYANSQACYLTSNELLPPYRSQPSYEGGWDGDFAYIAGGSWYLYLHSPGHFRYGTGGCEATLITALQTALA